MKLKRLSVLLVLFSSTHALAEPLDKFLDAIHQVESNGAPTVAPYQDCGSLAIGPLSIHKSFWLDSREKGEWRDCNDLKYSEKVTILYLNRYCPKAVRDCDFEVMARVFNGGPKGSSKSTTMKYWKRVEKILNSEGDWSNTE